MLTSARGFVFRTLSAICDQPVCWLLLRNSQFQLFKTIQVHVRWDAVSPALLSRPVRGDGNRDVTRCVAVHRALRIADRSVADPIDPPTRNEIPILEHQGRSLAGQGVELTVTDWNPQRAWGGNMISTAR